MTRGEHHHGNLLLAGNNVSDYNIFLFTHQANCMPRVSTIISEGLLCQDDK